MLTLDIEASAAVLDFFIDASLHDDEIILRVARNRKRERMPSFARLGQVRHLPLSVATDKPPFLPMADG
jgi:hypothetical protein